jgi:hypothetical protein
VRKILDALLWASAGSMLTFYVLMQGMSSILAPEEKSIAVAELVSARQQFWNLWWWALGTAVVIAVADVLVRWRSGELSR